ncbi:carboxymuconolactone decarboxylase family protein [Acidisoma sp. L85]|uniref:carboxymuconolactone decarboxylase family protein n=1 Tax=Acidisoma sp. L85 TaxID=1641850 RepID=UPI00131BAF82|nr:carboxymuconolactone decarboxylase family protein [Acidisoma sp. L85]
MARIAIPTKQQAPVKSQPILENYEKVLGTIPNFYAMISRSPDALEAIADVNPTLGKSLGYKTRERVHMMTAEVNGCSYCLTAHNYLGAKLMGLKAEDLEPNRSGHSSEPKAVAALTFAYKVVKSRGHIDYTDFTAARTAGFPDAEVVDIVAETAFSFLTNLFNNTFETERDSLFQPALTVRSAA